tara:strand:+ start:4484 stop:4690 length:207 start_codon:yes stop_codon:yes gene_type:complete
MPKVRKNLWDTSTIVSNNSFRLMTKEHKDILQKIDDINYKMIELKCEIDCLLTKKEYYLNKIKQLQNS